MFEKKITIKEYRELNAIHYSQLSSLASSPAYYKEGEKQDNDSLRLGSLVDCLLTRPEDFINEYKIADAYIPTGQMLEFCNYLIKDNDSMELAYNKVGFKREKLETVKERYKKEGEAYFTEVMNNLDKIIVPLNVHAEALVISNKIKNHKFTKDYFNESKYDIYYQVPLVIEIKRIDKLFKLKCLIDMIIVDKLTGEITPIDFKTTGVSVFQFKTEFIKWHYYLQASLYHYILMSVIYTENPEAKVNNFKFIVANSNSKEPPIVYNTTNNDLLIGSKGTVSRNERQIKGVVQLMEELIWHEENNLWEVPKEVYDSNGIINIEMSDYVN